MREGHLVNDNFITCLMPQEFICIKEILLPLVTSVNYQVGQRTTRPILKQRLYQEILDF